MKDWKEYRAQAGGEGLGQPASPGESAYDRSVEDFYAQSIEAQRAPPIPRGVRLARENAKSGPRETPLLALMQAREQVFKVEQRVLSLAGKLAGYLPEPEKDPNSAPMPSGVIHEMSQIGVDIQDAVARMQRDLDRIEDLLP